jgi:hypothetical protein
MGKARKHTSEQIVNILRQIEVAVANGKTHPVASREAGITEQTYYRWRMDYRVLLRMQAKDEHLRRALLAYAQYQNLMTAQFVACGRLHGVRERLARRLLMLQDRMGEGVLKLTQASLAGTLAVQRTKVTAVCGELEYEGILAHERGTLRILKRSALEAASCEWYRVTRRQLDSLYAEAGQRVDYPAAG